MRLYEARAKSGKKVLEVSRALDVSPAAVYQWERGETKPSTPNLVKLAELYGCTVDELLRGKGGENNEV